MASPFVQAARYPHSQTSRSFYASFFVEASRQSDNGFLNRHQLAGCRAGCSRRRLGNAAVIRDDARDVWGWTWLQDISQDMRFAGRRLMKDARFTVAVALAVGLGVGANNSVFTVINTACRIRTPLGKIGRAHV